MASLSDFLGPRITTSRVIDADTIDVDGERFRIRGIDANEISNVIKGVGDEPGARAAKGFVERNVDPSSVTSHGKGFFGRTLGDFLTTEGRDLGAELIRRGLASPTGSASPEQSMAELTQTLREAGVDLGDDPEQQALNARLEIENDIAPIRFDFTSIRGIRFQRPGTFGGAIARGTDNTQAMLFAATNAIGAVMHAETLEEWGADGLLRNMREAARTPARVARFDDIHSLADVGTYVLEALGEQVPQLAATLGTGFAVGTIVRATIGKALTRGMTLEAAEIMKSNIANNGFKAGAYTGIYGQVAGETQMEFVERGIDAPGLALLTGIPKAMIERFGVEAALIDTVTRTGIPAEILGSALKHIGRRALRGFAIEGGTEGVQHLMDNLAVASQDPTFNIADPENLKNLLDATLKGGIVGTAFGGVIGAKDVAFAPKANDDTTDEAKDDTTGKPSDPPLRKGAAEVARTAATLAAIAESEKLSEKGNIDTSDVVEPVDKSEFSPLTPEEKAVVFADRDVQDSGPFSKIDDRTLKLLEKVSGVVLLIDGKKIPLKDGDSADMEAVLNEFVNKANSIQLLTVLDRLDDNSIERDTLVASIKKRHKQLLARRRRKEKSKQKHGGESDRFKQSVADTAADIKVIEEVLADMGTGAVASVQDSEPSITNEQEPVVAANDVTSDAHQESLKRRLDKNGKLPDAAVPERAETIDAQVEAMLDPESGKDFVVVTPGTKFELKPTDGGRFEVALLETGYVVFSTDPAKIKALKAVTNDAAAQQKLFGEFIGAIDKGISPEATEIIQTVDKAGEAIEEIATKPEDVPAQVEIAEERARPTDTVQRTDLASVLAARQGLPDLDDGTGLLDGGEQPTPEEFQQTQDAAEATGNVVDIDQNADAPLLQRAMQKLIAGQELTSDEIVVLRTPFEKNTPALQLVSDEKMIEYMRSQIDPVELQRLQEEEVAVQDQFAKDPSFLGEAEALEEATPTQEKDIYDSYPELLQDQDIAEIDDVSIMGNQTVLATGFAALGAYTDEDGTVIGYKPNSNGTPQRSLNKRIRKLNVDNAHRNFSRVMQGGRFFIKIEDIPRPFLTDNVIQFDKDGTLLTERDVFKRAFKKDINSNGRYRVWTNKKKTIKYYGSRFLSEKLDSEGKPITRFYSISNMINDGLDMERNNIGAEQTLWQRKKIALAILLAHMKFEGWTLDPAEITPIVFKGVHRLKKIISGGQTGGDLGGLVAGKALGIETGGTAPKGFKTDAVNKSKAAKALKAFGLSEDNSASYVPRTKKNVDNSDGTVAFLNPRIKSAGTTKTIEYAKTGKWAVGNNKSSDSGKKPVLVLTPADSLEVSAKKLKAFIARNKINTLNVAGHREKSSPGLAKYVAAVIQKAQPASVAADSPVVTNDLVSFLQLPTLLADRMGKDGTMADVMQQRLDHAMKNIVARYAEVVARVDQLHAELEILDLVQDDPNNMAAVGDAERITGIDFTVAEEDAEEFSGVIINEDNGRFYDPKNTETLAEKEGIRRASELGRKKTGLLQEQAKLAGMVEERGFSSLATDIFEIEEFTGEEELDIRDDSKVLFDTFSSWDKTIDHAYTENRLTFAEMPGSRLAKDNVKIFGSSFLRVEAGFIVSAIKAAGVTADVYVMDIDSVPLAMQQMLAPYVRAMRANPDIQGKAIGVQGAAIILLRPGDQMSRMVAFAHELGHIVYHSYRQNLSESTRQHLRAAYNNTKTQEPLQMEIPFDEWFANKFAGWTLGQAAPNQRAEGIFKKLMRQLRRIWDRLIKAIPAEFGRSQTFEKVFMEPLLAKQLEAESALGIFNDNLTMPNRGDMRRVYNRGKSILKQGADFILPAFLTGNQELHRRGKHWLANAWSNPSQSKEGNTNPGVFDTIPGRQAEMRGIYDDALPQDDVVRERVFGYWEGEVPIEDVPVEDQQALIDVRKTHARFRGWLNKHMGGTVGQVPNHFPRTISVQQVLDRRAEFLNLLMVNVKGLTLVRANQIADHIISDNGSTEFADIMPPGFFSKKTRSLVSDGLSQVLRKGANESFLVDPRVALEAYINSGVKRAVTEAKFGVDVPIIDVHVDMMQRMRNGEEINHQHFQLINELMSAQRRSKKVITVWDGMFLLKKEIAETPIADRPRVQKIIDGYMGRSGLSISPEWRKYQSYLLMLEFTNTLTFSTFASVPDFGNILIRSKELIGGLRGITRGISNYAEAKEFARTLGVLYDAATSQALTMSIGSEFMNQDVQKAKDFFFKSIGLTQFTKMTRVIAAAAGRDFILVHARKAQAGDQRSLGWLAELNITPEQVANWDSGGQQMFVGGPNAENIRAIRDALFKFVDESILRPNPAQRPTYANDPRFALIWMLKSFYYAFGAVVLGGVYRAVKSGTTIHDKAMPVILAAITLLPLAIIGLELRYLVKEGLYALAGDDFEPQTENMDAFEYLLEVFDRAGGLGPISIAKDMFTANEFGNSTLFGFMGPAFQHLEMAVDGDRTVEAKILRTLPYQQLIPRIR